MSVTSQAGAAAGRCASRVHVPGRPWVHALALPVAALTLAATLLSRLAPVWLNVPDFGFGWFVPVAAGYLAWERWSDRPAAAPSPAPGWSGWTAAVLGLLALALLRLLLEPWPLWPAALWLFTAVILAFALGLIALGHGFGATRHFVFPLALIVTALPWPSLANALLIYPLREALAAAAAEFVSHLGYPAIAQGAVITVAGGRVGVDEACSGIRSLQAAIMAAFFLGELQRFTLLRRAALLAVGLALAFGGNLARTSLLVWQAARHGPNAVAAWHDVAGYIPLAFGLGGLALIAGRWQRHGAKPRPGSPPDGDGPRPIAPRAAIHFPRLAWCLAGGLLAVELGTQLWFGLRETRSGEVPRWTTSLAARAGFVADEFTPFMQSALGCDAHEIGHWRGADGTPRAGYVLNWRLGAAAQFKSYGHSPSICLPYTGLRLVEDRGRVVVPLGRLELPFDAQIFAGSEEVVYVYYLPWDVRRAQRVDAEAIGWSAWIGRRWSYVAQAHRRFDVTALALAIQGPAGSTEADRVFREEIAEIIRLAPAP